MWNTGSTVLLAAFVAFAGEADTSFFSYISGVVILHLYVWRIYKQKNNAQKTL